MFVDKRVPQHPNHRGGGFPTQFFEIDLFLASLEDCCWLATMTWSLSKKIKSMTSKTPPALTEAQKEHFLKYGFVKLPQCFSREDAAKWTEGVWERFGYTSDPSTWVEERPRLPDDKSIPASVFAPKAWLAICELLGGEERISDDCELMSP